MSKIDNLLRLAALSLFIVLCSVLSCPQALAVEEGTVQDGSNWSDYAIMPTINGSTYEITSPEELAWIAVESNKSNTFSFETVRLMNDIDLSAHIWIPIAASNSFSGHFDGCGYSITGMEIVTSTERGYTGLFGLVSGKINNLTVSGTIECAPSVVGGLVGMLYNGTIENCSTDIAITITGTSTAGYYSPRVGGLIGFVSNGTITTSSSTSEISGGAKASNGCATGGLIGCLQGATIDNCYAVSSISSADIAGGLIGEIYQTKATISNCYSSATISANDYYGGFSGKTELYNSSVENFYWNKDLVTNAIGRGYGGAVYSVTGLSENELIELSLIATAWDFENIWLDHSLENTYPSLRNPKKIPVEGISIDEDRIVLAIGETHTLQPSITPANASDPYIRWQSSDNTVATVSGGLIRAVTPGNATITATSLDGNFQDTCEILVLSRWIDGDFYSPALEDKTFKLTNAYELTWVAYKVSTGTTFSGYTIQLQNDIDLSACEWVPIGGWDNVTGTEDLSKEFCGIFDGNSFTISGMKIGSPGIRREYRYCGLFGKTDSAQIVDLNLSDAYINAYGEYGDLGVLVGKMDNTTIENCFVSGTVVANSSSVGGLVGSGGGKVLTSKFCGTVKNSGTATGGIIGGNYSAELFIDNATFEGTLTGSSYCGGVVGIGYESLKAVNCSVWGEIRCSKYWIGGLCGRLSGIIENSCCVADISSNSSSYSGAKIGGLVGEILSDGRIINCYVSGNVTGYGIAQSNAGSILCCYYNSEKNILHNQSTEGIPDDEAALSATAMINGDLTDALNSVYDQNWSNWESNANADGLPMHSTGSNANSWTTYAVQPTCDSDGIYHIRSAEELAWIAIAVEGGQSFENDFLVLDCDIALYGHYWEPIGGWDGYSENAGMYFKGHFDGNGHTISGLTVGSSVFPRQYGYSALFGRCQNATIRNVILKDTAIFAAGDCAAGLVGFSQNSRIEFCTVNGEIKGNDLVGSIAGSITSSSGILWFRGNYAEATVSGNDRVGGLLGNSGNTSHILISSIKQNAFVGSVAGRDNIGGLVGDTDFPITICYTRGSVSGRYNVGGIVGNCDYYDITKCYSTSDISGEGAVGAVIGYAKASNTENGNDCYWSTDAIHTIGGYDRDVFEKSGVGSGIDSTVGKALTEMQNQSFLDLLNDILWHRSTAYNDSLPYFAALKNDMTFSTVELNDNNGTDIVEIPNALFKVSAKVEGYRSDHHSLLIAACYDIHGRLLNIEEKNITVSASDSEEFTFSFDNTAGDIQYIKMFILDKEIYSPMCKSVAVD